MTTPAAPHVTYNQSYSPLSALISQVVRIYGDFASTDGETVMMFLNFANEILSDIRKHPYGAAFASVPDYKHPADTRDVPDRVIRAGLLYYYAVQQGSAKTAPYSAAYYKTLNGDLWDILNGNTPISLRAVDATSYSTTNGQPNED